MVDCNITFHMIQKTVLIVANDYTTIYNFRLELLQRLKSENYNIVLLLPYDKRNDAFLNYAKVESIPLSRFGTNPLQDIKTFFAIRKFIIFYQPRFVFTYTAKPNIYGGLAARVCKVPYACNVTGLGKNLQTKNVVGSIMLYLQRIAYQKAEVVYFQNEANYNVFKSHHVVNDQAEILPGSGVNLLANQFETFPNNIITTFIVIARIRQDKGYDELFDAVRKCVANNIPARFKIVGWYEDNNYKSKVENIQKTGIVEIIGDTPHEKVHGLLKESDCLIHPSHHEGMSNVILEAAACGRPCIVSNIHGCIEGVKNNISGFHFEVKNSQSLFEKIVSYVSLTKEEKIQMGIEARRLMEKKFDRNNVVERYISLLNNIIA